MFSLTLTLTLVFASASAVAYQTSPPPKPQPPGIEEVIRRFAVAETQNSIARKNYAFTQDYDMRTIGEAGSITGRFHRVSDIVLDDHGNRIEKITFFPPSTLVGLDPPTQEDIQDLSGVQPFALTTEDLPKYQIDYVGKEKIDELNTYVFDVKPKAIRKGERYLEGRIWVDDQDLQVVKVKGQAVPEVRKQKFPHFESYRENIDGRYWFPTYIYADDVLGFKDGDIHIRMVVRFTNYKKFGGRIRVADEGETASEEEVKAAEKNKPVTPAAKSADQQQSKPELKKPKKP
ncbi:MAG TPA: hypothetical protein VI837_00975 [Blastocatellia bacterium]|nr:hypothetical protein [Blastocatellia bacterium]